MIVELVQGYAQELLLAFSIIVSCYYFILRPFVFSPLKHVPGPYLHRISSLPNLMGEQGHTWVQWVHELHEKYGDVVILSPNSVSFNDTKYSSDIYTKNMPKSDFYANFGNHGEPNIFATLKNKEHLALKKTIMGLYSKSAIFSNCQKLLEDKVRDMMSCIGANTKSHEVYMLFSALAMDVVTSFELGAKNGSRYLINEESRSIILKHRMVSSMGFWTTRAPRFWDWVAPKDILKAAEELEKWQLEMYANAELKKSQDCTLDVLNNYGITGKAAYSLLSDNIFAGHETTATMMTYLTYELSRQCNTHLQAKLQRELDETFVGEDFITNLTKVDELEYLNAVLLETLRVHASIPGAEPRVTNKPYTVNISGRLVTLPTGTIVSCQPFSLHRKQDVFAEPDVFIPERWLKFKEESEEMYDARLKKQHRHMMAFGKGIRMCLGMNLALIEMKLAIANIYFKYNSRVSEEWCKVVNEPTLIGLCTEIGEREGETDIEKMQMVDSYTIRPLRDECWLSWERRK